MKMRIYALAAACAIVLSACVSDPIGGPTGPGHIDPDAAQCPRPDGDPCR